jgi:hypothetical protein
MNVIYGPNGLPGGAIYSDPSSPNSSTYESIPLNQPMQALFGSGQNRFGIKKSSAISMGTTTSILSVSEICHPMMLPPQVANAHQIIINPQSQASAAINGNHQQYTYSICTPSQMNAV